MTKLQEIRLAVSHCADSIGQKKNGNFIFRRSFYYRHGMTAEKFKNEILSLLAHAKLMATVVDYGEHYTSFRGGATVAQGSHWWVEVEVL